MVITRLNGRALAKIGLSMVPPEDRVGTAGISKRIISVNLGKFPAKII